MIHLVISLPSGDILILRRAEKFWGQRARETEPVLFTFNSDTAVFLLVSFGFKNKQDAYTDL